MAKGAGPLYCVEVHMSSDEKEVEAELPNDHPAAVIIWRWIEIRQRKGLTREAALAELNAASSIVVGWTSLTCMPFKGPAASRESRVCVCVCN